MNCFYWLPSQGEPFLLPDEAFLLAEVNNKPSLLAKIAPMSSVIGTNDPEPSVNQDDQ